MANHGIPNHTLHNNLIPESWLSYSRFGIRPHSRPSDFSSLPGTPPHVHAPFVAKILRELGVSSKI